MNGSIPTDPTRFPIRGAADTQARLVAADEALYALQAAAGARLGEPIAVPQLAAVVREALANGRTLRRAIVAASQDHDLELRVNVAPDADGGVSIAVEDWRTLPRGEARFSQARATDFVVDTRMRLTSLDPAVASRFGVELASLPRPFTEVVNLLARRDGSLPLLDALSSGTAFPKQRATVKSRDFPFAFAGTPVCDEAGELTGFQLTILNVATDPAKSEEGFDVTLQSPLTRIIHAADQIVDRTDGPLRSDYANYAGDIATAGRHLLSVIRSMSSAVGGREPAETVDLRALTEEAVAMVSADARRAGVEVEIEEADGAVRAQGEARGILQILVNITGNAIRHSEAGGTVAIVFDEQENWVTLTVADQGPGIDRADQARIFEEYERLGPSEVDHAGLGLAISRRLARSMRGDIELESAKGEGARFTLKLPRP